MRVSLKWLSELVELPSDPLLVAEKLTAVGLEVEAVEDLQEALEGVVVARVGHVEKHPQADKLRVCQVESGGATVQVVCGAANVAEGVFVPFAPAGTVLPGNKRIEKATLRGVESNGMLCSAAELGLPQSSDGLLLLREGDPGVLVGAPIAPAVGRDDVVLTLGVTPNRPDALSHIGVARELAAAFRSRFKAQVPTCPERGGPVDDLAKVTIEDVDGCPRYACRVIEGVVVAPSPPWLVARLAACGVRAVNNVVDVTNLVMMERGLPLHAFDCDRIARHGNRAAVIVRSAKSGEKLVTLDGKDRELHDTDLVVADTEKALALAGVMGGADSEVRTETTRVLLEAAFFSPARVRKTARRLALHSEASHRFERGCDPNAVLVSLDRAAALIAELSLVPNGGDKPTTGVLNITNGRVARGVVDAYPKKISPAIVALRPKRAAQILGVPQKLVDEASISKLLLSLGLEVEGSGTDNIRFRVPTYRPDLVREIDLIEEVLRLIGADAVPTTLPSRSGEAEGLFDQRRHRVLERARAVLEGAGFDEAVNLAFVAPHALVPFDGGDLQSRITLKNPLGEEMSVMRKSLLPGLLANVGTNQRRGRLDVRLYETASVFLGKNPGGKAPRLDIREGPLGADAFAREIPRLSGVLAGQVGARGVGQAPVAADFLDMKGVVEDILQSLGVESRLAHSPVSFVAADDRYPFLHPRARAEVWVQRPGASPEAAPVRHWIGVVGEIHRDLVQAYDLRSRVYVFELDVDALSRIAQTVRRTAPLPRFPSVRRDFAFVVDAALSAQALCARLSDNGSLKGLLEEIDVFDVYQGKGIPPGKKSVAVALTLRAPDRTLAEDEIGKIASLLMEDVGAHFGAEVRA